MGRLNGHRRHRRIVSATGHFRPLLCPFWLFGARRRASRFAPANSRRKTVHRSGRLNAGGPARGLRGRRLGALGTAARSRARLGGLLRLRHRQRGPDDRSVRQLRGCRLDHLVGGIERTADKRAVGTDGGQRRNRHVANDIIPQDLDFMISVRRVRNAIVGHVGHNVSRNKLRVHGLSRPQAAIGIRNDQDRRRR